MNKLAPPLFALVAITAILLAACGGSAKSPTPCRVPAGQVLKPASNVTVGRNIAYGTEAGQPLLLDVYRPSDPGSSRPGVLVVHSGGWVGGDKAAWALESASLAKAGFVAFDANYTLSTPSQPGWPLQLQELRTAVRWIRAHAAAYGVDPQHVGALGGSAGGNLVELLGGDASGPCTQGDRIGATVAWSGPTDLRGLDTGAFACLHGQRACGGNGLVSLIPAFLTRYLGCPASTCGQKWTAASPVNHASGDDPPTLLINSSAEVVPLDQVKAYGDELAAVRVPHTLIVYPGGAHAEAYAARAMAPTIRFLARYLG